MILTNCNCGEKVACVCGTLSFDAYVASSTSVLDVGNLVSSNGCVLDEYVIDWYRDGVHALVTGKGYDPDIEAFHPMTGLAATPVIGGTYTAVVRYIVVGGVQIFLEPKACKKWCEIIQNMPTITVSSIDCATIGGSPASFYKFRINYQHTQDYALAVRTVLFFHGPTTAYLALYFIAANVADRLTVYHSSDLENPITDWIVGLDTTHWDDSLPYRTKNALKTIIPVTGYETGDYFVIKVKPSVVSGILETNWSLDMVCLTSPYVIDYNRFAGLPNPYKVDTVSAIYDTVNCRFVFSIDVTNDFLPLTSAGSYPFGFLGMTSSSLPVSKTLSMNVSNNIDLSSGTTTFPGCIYTFMTTAGNITITKTGNVLSFVCADAADYNDYKTSYNGIMATSWGTGWTDDPTKLTYYRWWWITLREASVQCGQDGQIDRSCYIFIDSEFDFDDANLTLTVTLKSITNGYATSPDPCHKVHSRIDSHAANINNFISGSDFSFTTRCKNKHQFGQPFRAATIVAPAISGATEKSFSLINKRVIPNVESLAGPWCEDSLGRYSVYEYKLGVRITTTRDSEFNWLAPPLDNFEITWGLDPETGCSNLNTIIYKKVGGVVTIAKAFSELYLPPS